MEISFKKSIIQPGVTPIENMFLDNYLPIVDEISLNENGKVERIEFVNNFALYAGGIYDNNVEEKEKEKPLIDNKEYYNKIEQITGLTLKPHEISEIMAHIEETGHGMDLVYKAYEYANSTGKSMSAKYIIGILRAWKRDNNISTVEDLQNYFENKDKNKIKRYSKNTKKYIEKEHILTDDEKIEKLKNNNSATSELLDRY